VSKPKIKREDLPPTIELLYEDGEIGFAERVGVSGAYKVSRTGYVTHFRKPGEEWLSAKDFSPSPKEEA